MNDDGAPDEQSALRPIEEVRNYDEEVLAFVRSAVGDLPYAYEATALLCAERDDGKGRHGVLLPAMPSAAQMILTEFLMHIWCTKSDAGYEAAMEMLCQGAMSYKTKRIDRSDEENS